MTAQVVYLNPPTLSRNPMLTQAVVVSGTARTVYIGGQNGVDATGAIVGAGDLTAQVEQVYDNLEAILAAASGACRNRHVVDLRRCRSRPRPALGIFTRRWDTADPPPAIGVLTAVGLANPAFLIEIEAIAVVHEEGTDAD